ncbi:DnaT-like ssDNA-binding domain-containing protein [Morganella morganii]|uniref:DnaT-like ssDNA-binding domain-containing protein n=1 Tax=Morganella morganii TaxID=582 RepID=UPI0034D6F982
MARIRTIKPTFWTDEDMAEVSEAACLLAIGLLNYADDEGYFNANPKLIKAAVFPLREPSGSIPVLLQELSNCGYIRLFSAQNGKRFGLIINFTKHQVINKKTISKIKEMGLIPEDYGSDTGELPPGREGKGKERNIKTTLSGAHEENFIPVPDAEDLPAGNWSDYPGKFVMTGHWQPDPDFSRKAAQWGVILNEPYRPEELAEFVTYWQAEGKAKRHAQWEMAFARSIHQQRMKTNGGNNGTNKHNQTGSPFAGKSRAMQKFLQSVHDNHGPEAVAALVENDRAVRGQMDQEEQRGTVIDVEASNRRIE